MKQFCSAVLAAAKEHLTTAAQMWAGVSFALCTLFTVVGMLVTLRLWLPLLATAGMVIAAVFAFRQHRKRIPPERRAQLLATACTAVAFTLRPPIPYTFDTVTPQEAACHAGLTRDSGADIVSVRLLVLEKQPQGMDGVLLQQVFAQRLLHFSNTAGLTGRAYSPELPLLTLAGMELIGQELTLHILYADNRAALLYYRKLQEQTREARTQAAAARPPHQTPKEG